MLAYKSARNGRRRVVVTLEIPEDATTNLNRSNIAVKQTAKHRTNKAKVIKIEDNNGRTYTTAESFHFSTKRLIYNVGAIVEEPAFDPDLEKVCAEGIHFFLDYNRAVKYGLNFANGLNQVWYENGQLWYESNTLDNKTEGLFRQWGPSGEKECEVMFVLNKKEGLYQEWHPSGQRVIERFYRANKLHGPYRAWYSSGQLQCEGYYKNGKKHGIFTEYQKNGEIFTTYTYANGERVMQPKA